MPSHSRYRHDSGDSLSDIGYSIGSRRPSPENPLGVPFPGRTFAGPGRPNWVGHLITKYMPPKSVLVYDYAVGGADVWGIRRQIMREFIPEVGKKPDWAPWSSDDSLFGESKTSVCPSASPTFADDASTAVTWVGTNDCA